MISEKRKQQNKESSLRWQRKMMAEDSPAGESFRAKRREVSRKARAKKAAEREEVKLIAGMAERIAQDNAKRKVQPSVQKKRFDTPIEPRRPSQIEVTPAKPKFPSTEEWIKAGGQVQRLQSQLGAAFIGLGRGDALSLY